MSVRIQVVVFEKGQQVQTADFDGPVEIGRQKDRDEGLFSRKKEGDHARWVVARRDEIMVGRSQLHLEPLPGNQVRINNGSSKSPLRFADGSDLPPSVSCVCSLPVQIVLSQEKMLRVQPVPVTAAPRAEQFSLAAVTIPPRLTGSGSRLPNLVTGSQQGPSRDLLLNWLNSAMDVLQAAAGSEDFFDRAASAVVDTVGLDAARVLLFEGGVWKERGVKARRGTDSSELALPSRSVLEKMARERKPTWEVFGAEVQQAQSLAGVDTVVAAPILDRAGEVIGALYGERQQMTRGRLAFGEPEARLVELLARGVAAGLARLEEERRAVQMEQFFTPELARQLLDDPQLLDGQDREVTVLFCDIRGFSRISERLGPARTIHWCREVLDLLSDRVHAHGGVVVDYTGDGLMAMWGAPGEQPDHASRACRAALDILEQMPSLDEKWQQDIGEPTGLGIGVNTGTALVGNVGSKYKLKYGALGNTVNLGSRIQGATKYFKCKVLLAGSTQEKLDDSFATRRLGRVKVVGIAQGVDLYELFPRGCPFAQEGRQEYETALRRFEEEHYAEAVRLMGNWRGRCPEDDPVLVLMYRAVESLVKGRAPGHPVWELLEK